MLKLLLGLVCIAVLVGLAVGAYLLWLRAKEEREKEEAGPKGPQGFDEYNPFGLYPGRNVRVNEEYLNGQYFRVVAVTPQCYLEGRRPRPFCDYELYAQGAVDDIDPNPFMDKNGVIRLKVRVFPAENPSDPPEPLLMFVVAGHQYDEALIDRAHTGENLTIDTASGAVEFERSDNINDGWIVERWNYADENNDGKVEDDEVVVTNLEVYEFKEIGKDNDECQWAFIECDRDSGWTETLYGYEIWGENFQVV